MTAQEISTWLGYSVRTIITEWSVRYAESGGLEGIPCRRFPGARKWRYVEQDIQGWLDQGALGPSHS
ncbi:MAG TPA: hypothetical protein VEK84_00900, partial [Terriglobales bacterium]|nr:hypothetical protein [Terriglobales bacterium]